MSPAKAGRALAALIPGARAVVEDGAGHMLMAERPKAVLKAITALIESASGLSAWFSNPSPAP